MHRVKTAGLRAHMRKVSWFEVASPGTWDRGLGEADQGRFWALDIHQYAFPRACWNSVAARDRGCGPGRALPIGSHPVMSTSEPSTATVAISEIRVFSAFLHRYQPGKTIQNGSPPEKDRRVVIFLTHLYTLFATGRTTSLIVAATGRVSPDAAEATIVVSSNSSNSTETLVDPFREVHIQPRGDFAMSDLLKLPK